MKINEKESGYAVHGNIIAPQSIKEKHPEVTEDNKYKYLGLQIYEVNKDKFNEEFIISKITKSIEEIKKLDLNNKTTIKCINTQIMSLIRYFIGPIIFSIGCLNKVDTLIRKALYEMDYMKKYQCGQRLYLKEDYLGGSLISARDMHLKTLINIYRTITHRKQDDKLKLVSESIKITWNIHDILHKIEIHQNI